MHIALEKKMDRRLFMLVRRPLVRSFFRRQQNKHFHSSPLSTFHRSLIRSEKITKSSSLDNDNPTSAAELRNSILRAPFQRVVGGNGQALFPWRSSDQLLERLVPGSEEFEEKGYLLGGNVFSSNPMFDAYATAFLFLRVPLYQMLFFSHWQQDLAENVSWAFSQGVAGILSNVYQMPMDGIKSEEGLDFETILSSNRDGEEVQNDDTSLDSELLNSMVEGRLKSLFESAHENGKDHLQVRLDCRPTGNSHMVNLFVFPFLSRHLLEIQPELKERYQRMLELMVASPKEALPMYHHFVQDFEKRGWTHNTVIAQFLVECDEIFWVKDMSTGQIIQGQQDENNSRKVMHLVRMEMVVKTKLNPRGLIIPIKHSQGQWQITDIDDLLGGNLII